MREKLIPFLLIVSVVTALRWINVSKAEFIYDEKDLVTLAKAANAEGKLATRGLQGTRKAFYGPVSVWLIQFWLIFTDDPQTLRRIQGAFTTIIHSSGLLLLGSALAPFFHWLLPFVFLFVPLFWFYSHSVWDNPLLIPFSTLANACYYMFEKSRDARWLLLVSLFCSLLVGTHLMSVAFLAAISFHFLVFHRKEILRHWKVMISALIIFLFPIQQYLWALLTNDQQSASGHLFPWFHRLGDYPIFAFKVLSPLLLKKILFEVWDQSFWAKPIAALSVSVFILGVLGFFRAWRENELRSFAVFCLILTGCSFLLFVAMRIPINTQYFNATWIGFAGFLLLAWKHYRDQLWMKVVGSCYVLSLISGVLFFVTHA